MATPRKNPEDYEKVGRPTDYNDELARRICTLVATNRSGIKKLCKENSWMPDHTTVHEWRWKHPEFANQYLEAKKSQMELQMDELNEIMDENLIYYVDDKGNERIDSPSATIAIAKANNAKWFAAKLAPKIYGEGVGKLNEKAESLIEKVIDKLVEE